MRSQHHTLISIDYRGSIPHQTHTESRQEDIRKTKTYLDFIKMIKRWNWLIIVDESTKNKQPPPQDVKSQSQDPEWVKGT